MSDNDEREKETQRENKTRTPTNDDSAVCDCRSTLLILHSYGFVGVFAYTLKAVTDMRKEKLNFTSYTYSEFNTRVRIKWCEKKWEKKENTYICNTKHVSIVNIERMNDIQFVSTPLYTPHITQWQ